MKLSKKNALAWGIVALALGIMVSVQYRDVVLGGAAFWSSLPDVNSVETKLTAVSAYNRSLRLQMDQLSKKMAELRAKTIARGGDIAVIERKIHAMNVLLGTLPLTGPGIQVTISDKQMTGKQSEAFLTHDWDLRSVINELFDAGADAVAVNNARITLQTGVFCIGPVVRIGSERLGSPFVIKAIGPAHVLATALNIPGGVLDVLKAGNRGLYVSRPQVLAKVTVPAYTPELTANQGTARNS